MFGTAAKSSLAGLSHPSAAMAFRPGGPSLGARGYADVNNEPSGWSEATTFEMGLLKPNDWTAQWITNSEFVTGKNALPMFAKPFDVPCNVESARLYATGLGVFQAEVNGHPVSEEVLGPGYSTVNRTILYRTYDVGALLQKGHNVLGVELGKGTYDAEKGLLKR